MSNNVYICQFSLDKVVQYKIRASIKDSGFDYLDIRDILEIREESDSEDVLEKKRKYHPFALELERTNHFAVQSKIVPDALWTGIEKKEIKTPTKQNYIFSIWSGGIVFNQTCANILKQHRLGENILTPVQIYDLSTGKVVNDEVFYFFNLYERRQFICKEQSDKIFVYIQGAKRYSTRGIPIDNKMLEVDKSALNCDIDVWYDDRLGGYFFMSESLYNSLSEAGMIDKFNPHTCKLV